MKSCRQRLGTGNVSHSTVGVAGAGLRSEVPVQLMDLQQGNDC